MKISLEILRYNLQLLEEVKTEFPILQDYEDGKLAWQTITNTGLTKFSDIIAHNKSNMEVGIETLYTRDISYSELRDKMVEYETNTYFKSIFKNKTRKKFDEMWLNPKLMERYRGTHRRRKRGGYMVNTSSSLTKINSMIINYLYQNQIEVHADCFINFPDSGIFFEKLTKPKSHARELKMTQDFVDEFVKFAKRKKLDVRKCNVQVLTSEFNKQIRNMMVIENGSLVKCISEMDGFEVGKSYVVEGTQVDYNGFLEIILTNENKSRKTIPYTNFEEVSRQREDQLSKLGIK